MNKKIRVVPCTVKILLYVIESAINCTPGLNNSTLKSKASAPPINMKAKEVIK